MLNPHHPRIFLHEDDDAGVPRRAGAAGRAEVADNASAPPGDTGVWPTPRMPARNTAGHGNTGGKHERKHRNRRNAGKAEGRWPRPPVWRMPGGRGKKTEGAAPGPSGSAELASKVRSCLLRTFTCSYPNNNEMTTAAGNTSRCVSGSFYDKNRMRGGKRKTRKEMVRLGVGPFS